MPQSSFFGNVWGIARESAKQWVEVNATRLSAAIAFYSILSIAPLFIIAIAIAGQVLGPEAAAGELKKQISETVGQPGAEVVQTAIANADRPKAGVVATIIGVATLLFGASGVFGELQDALNTAWHVKPKEGRGVWGMIRARFLSFGMVVVIGFLLLISLVIATTLSSFGGYLSGLVPGLPVLMQVANFVISFLVVTTLFALLFKVLPDAKIAWRDVWVGAAVTSALFTIGKYAIGLYLGKAAVATPFGAAGSLVAFVVWLYYSGLILFFGAILTKVTAEHAGRKITPSENAEIVPPADAKPRV